MSDVPEARRRTMAAIRGRDTKPEIALRKALHAMGYRFRLHRRTLPGTPDLVFPARRAAIQVHGCFWHHHSGCRHATMPSTRREYWAAKLARNVERDRNNAARLESMGWQLLVVWECELAKPTAAMARAAEFLGPAGTAGHPCSPDSVTLQSGRKATHA